MSQAITKDCDKIHRWQNECKHGEMIDHAAQSTASMLTMHCEISCH